MKKILILGILSLLACFSGFCQSTVDLQNVSQEDLLMIQKEVANDILSQKGKITTEQLDVLTRIQKSSNSTTVSFSKVPKTILDDDLKSAFQRCSMYFNSLEDFKKFKKSLRTAYSKDTSVVTRIILKDQFLINRLPKEYFVNLAKTND